MYRISQRCIASSSFSSPKKLLQPKFFRLNPRCFHNTLLRKGPSSSSSSLGNSPSDSNVSNSFLTGNSAVYIDAMFDAWKKDPNSVHTSWNAYFSSGSYTPPPSLGGAFDKVQGQNFSFASNDNGAITSLTSKVVLLVRSFQVRGHLLATIDPLGIMGPRQDHEDLKLESYGFTAADLDKPIDLTPLTADLKGFLDRHESGHMTLGQLYGRLKEVYCSNIGYEYMHIPSVEKCNWIRERIETRQKILYSKAEKLQILDRLTWADHFETFLSSKFSTAKRFGLEGAESFIAGMKAMIQRSCELGVENVVIGMPHRGRLNVLNTVVRKPLEQIFREFGVGQTGQHDPEAGPGDVKYHLGMSRDAPIGPDGRIIHLSLVANPSHLETVDPVVLGKTRAKQYWEKDTTHSKSMALLLHGDAAFAGQGVVYESMGMMDLPGYKTGGTVHMVVNNQVGFTTDPNSSRSTPYCTDIGKTYNVPIFHVNADDPEAVVFVSQLAAEYRCKFQTDVIIDLVCYRRHGHNEVDEPMFTQPLMYEKIKQHPSTLKLYQQRLLSEGIDQASISAISATVNTLLNNAYEASKDWDSHKQKDWLAKNWKTMKAANNYSEPQKTGLDTEQLRTLGLKTTHYPANFNLHPRLAGIIATRVKTLKEGKDLDWATGEALAFSSLLSDGFHVRLSGQDVERGTFSHRHAVLHDIKTNETYCPLQHLSPTQPAFSVYNSHLSEYGVLGFEVGYSIENPHALVMWEGQFGDFFNTAQVIVDQFLSSMEEKWNRQSGLVLLLPHGYEGAGPEHSSGRLERFLQQSNDHPDQIPDKDKTRQIQQANWQVANVSTPANYFHILRRQVMREFRKPLILMTPKSLLRHPLARSTLDQMGPGTSFTPVYGEVDDLEPKKVTRVILCTGKVYYDLLQRRIDKGIHHIAIIRLEQIAPFPFHAVSDEVNKYLGAEIVWVQEEPMNMGAWTYVKPRLETALKAVRGSVPIKYVGRPPMGSTAAGKEYVHKKEQEKLVVEALQLPHDHSHHH